MSWAVLTRELWRGLPVRLIRLIRLHFESLSGKSGLNSPVGKKGTRWGLVVATYYWSIAVVGLLLLAVIEILVRMFTVSDRFFYSTVGRMIVVRWLLLMLLAFLSTLISPFVFALASRWPAPTCRLVRKAIVVFLASDILQGVVWRMTGLYICD